MNNQEVTFVIVHGPGGGPLVGRMNVVAPNPISADVLHRAFWQMVATWSEPTRQALVEQLANSAACVYCWTLIDGSPETRRLHFESLPRF